MNRQLDDWQIREICGMDAKETYSEAARQAWRRRVAAIFDVLGLIAAALEAVALFILYCFATPEQLSAECEILRAEMEVAEASR